MDHRAETSNDVEQLERRQLKVATRQVVFREINEKLEELNTSFSGIIPLGDFVCECEEARFGGSGTTAGDARGSSAPSDA